MKAYEVQGSFGLENLVLFERAMPSPGAGEALVRIRAVALNARDGRVIRGLYNPKWTLPLTPCSDMAGEVVEVGPSVERVKAGDRVAANFMTRWIGGELTRDAARSALGGEMPGVLAEYAALPADCLVHLPPHLSWEQASTLPCAGLTAWHALMEETRLRAGDVVLVQGTGGVSIFALQFARLAGARTIVLSSSDTKLKRASDLGAWHTVNYRANPEWDKLARAVTEGRGVDQVVEVVGEATLEKSLRAVRTGGTISLIGMLSGAPSASLIPVFMRNLRLQGIFVGSRGMFEAMNQAVAAHEMTPVIDRVFEFGQAAEALGYLETGSHFGKVVIRVGAPEKA